EAEGGDREGPGPARARHRHLDTRPAGRDQIAWHQPRGPEFGDVARRRVLGPDAAFDIVADESRHSPQRGGFHRRRVGKPPVEPGLGHGTRFSACAMQWMPPPVLEISDMSTAATSKPRAFSAAISVLDEVGAITRSPPSDMKLQPKAMVSWKGTSMISCPLAFSQSTIPGSVQARQTAVSFGATGTTIRSICT